jgi:hypothetical protein
MQPKRSKPNAFGDIANVPKDVIDVETERKLQRRRLSKSASYLKVYPSEKRNVSARHKVAGER